MEGFQTKVCVNGNEQSREQVKPKYYDFMNDGLFKFVFGMKSHEKVAIALLNSLLRLDGNDVIQELEFLNPFNIKEHSDDKISIVDTRVKDASGRYYNIELQARAQKSFTKRFAYYLSKLYSSQLNETEKYNQLRPAIGLAILGFNLYPDSERIDEEFVFRNRDCSISLNNIMRMHFVDLTKIASLKEHKNLSEMTLFEKWAYLLYNGSEYIKPDADLPQELKGVESMEDAIEYAKQANADETIRQIMWDRERYWIDRSLDHGEWYDEGQKSRQPEVDKLKKEVDTEKNRINDYWNHSLIKRPMCEVFFWFFIAPIFFSVQSIVGCEYVFLFAADLSKQRSLISYYQDALNFSEQTEFGTNKPIYDLNCCFMCQKINDMKKNHTNYFENFNSDPQDFI